MKKLITIVLILCLSQPLLADIGEKSVYSEDVFRYGGIELPSNKSFGEVNSGLFYNYQANLYMFRLGIKKDLFRKINLQLNYIMASRDFDLFPGKRSMEFVQVGARFRLLKNK